MKLEHYAAYLPYRLKVARDDFYLDSETRQVTAVKNIEIMEMLGDDDIVTNEDEYLFITLKPILRPFSDLTKEIEINGEKFVPIEKIWKDCESASNTFDYKELLVEEVNLENILQYPYEIIVKLLTWHFDIFNLIEKGEAIDINTIA